MPCDQNTLALVYDFDKTLTPRDMQEYTVLPRFQIDPSEFWKEVKLTVRVDQADEILTYMRLMVEKIGQQDEYLTRTDLNAMASKIEYFPGVDTWFERMREYVSTKSNDRVSLQQYIVSAGLKEIIEGTTIISHFSHVYASEYCYDDDGHATWPKLAINDTNKTQFLFRINKGRERLEETINEHMPEAERPIPFPNMIYIGDGLTDVPCMNVVRKYGGYAVAVYSNDPFRLPEKCQDLLDAKRIDFAAVADYQAGGRLDRQIKLMLDVMIARVLQSNDAHLQTGE